jgi:hypothetical protein
MMVVIVISLYASAVCAGGPYSDKSRNQKVQVRYYDAGFYAGARCGMQAVIAAAKSADAGEIMKEQEILQHIDDCKKEDQVEPPAKPKAPLRLKL